jgi:hypothetical protein
MLNILKQMNRKNMLPTSFAQDNIDITTMIPHIVGLEGCLGIRGGIQDLDKSL